MECKMYIFFGPMEYAVTVYSTRVYNWVKAANRD
jgi:hypothetical protein